MLARRPTSRPFRSLVSSTVHRHIRWAGNDRVINLTAAGTPNQRFEGYNFELTDVQNASELTNLYDQYMIEKVELFFDWTPFEGAGVGTTDQVFAPVMMWYIDRDDSATPTETDIKQRANAVQHRLNANKTYKVTVTPNVLSEVYRSAVSTSYVPKRFQKLDMANPDVPHYGLKVWVRGRDGINTGRVNVRLRYHLKCYSPR